MKPSNYQQWTLIALSALGLTVSACGGAQFARNPNAPKYKALPVKTEVVLAATAGELPQPVEELGTFQSESKQGEADRAKVTEEFKSNARRFGCDALVGLQLKDDERKATRTVQVRGDDGKYHGQPQEFTTHVYVWSAGCVRTQKQTQADKVAPVKAKP